MTLQEFLEHARNFAHLGDAVGSQLEAVAADHDAVADQNPNALDLAADRFLRPLMKYLVHVDDDNDELTELRGEVDQLLFQFSHPAWKEDDEQEDDDVGPRRRRAKA